MHIYTKSVMGWKGRFAAVFTVLVIKWSSVRCWAEDPTSGFTDLPFNTSHYKIHKPYDLPETQRYTFIDGVHRFWVYATDNPFRKGSPTRPRTEIMINGYMYRSGVWQFQGEAFVPNGTNGACIMQVFGAGDGHATTLMLRVQDSSLMYYRFSVILPDIFDRWFKVNVIHDVEGESLQVFVDGVALFRAPGRGGKSHYFKLGVYGMKDVESYYMESRWRGIRVLYRNASSAAPLLHA